AGPVHRADDPPDQRHPACVPGELARLQLRSAPAGDRDVEQEDREHTRDRQRYYKAHATTVPGHAGIVDASALNPGVRSCIATNLLPAVEICAIARRDPGCARRRARPRRAAQLNYVSSGIPTTLAVRVCLPRKVRNLRPFAVPRNRRGPMYLELAGGLGAARRNPIAVLLAQ